jgi:oligosaccharide repeat unit polymerase
MAYIFLIPGCLFLLAGSKHVRLGIIVSGLVILAYVSAFFFLGDRQHAILSLIAFIWVYHRIIRPVPRGLLLGGGSLMLFVVFPVLASIRGISGQARSSSEAFVTAFFSLDNPMVASISEIGSSMKTVAYTIILVPHYRDFDLGTTYLYSFLSVVPNLFWKVNPSSYAAVDKWLMQTVSPVMANKGSFSWAYSLIAEAYLNFGWFGAPLALGIMGFILAKLVLWADKPIDPAKIALVGALMAILPIYARGEFLEIARPIVWGALIPYLGVRVLRSLWLKPLQDKQAVRRSRLSTGNTALYKRLRQ